MKIGIIIRFLNISGGGERQAIMLAKELIKKGQDVKIYTFAYDKDKCFPGLLGDLRIIVLKNPPKRSPLIISRLPFIGTLSHLWSENRNAKSLALLIDENTELLNPHDQISTHVAYFFKKYVKKIPSVLMLNDLHIASWSLFDDPLFNPPRRSILKCFFNWLRDAYENYKFFSSQDKIIVLNDRTVGIVKKYLGRDSEVVRSGADIEQFSYKERLPIQGRRLNILCHGIFYIHRRFEDVIGGVKNLVEWGYDPYLTIIGDYKHKDTARDYYQKLAKLVSDLGLENRVRFAGAVSDQELKSAYQNFDVFVFASHMQTWGLAVFEAMASGLPVVLSKTAGASEVLTDGENVLLVDPGSFSQIAGAIKKLADDGDLYLNLSSRGNDFVRKNITWDNYVKSMLEFFSQATVNFQ